MNLNLTFLPVSKLFSLIYDSKLIYIHENIKNVEVGGVVMTTYIFNIVIFFHFFRIWKSNIFRTLVP